jgi:2,3-bisphosphoglycerate-independent phosphoglycerate mutase
MTTTMDRYEANWEVVANGWRAHVQGAAQPVPSVLDAIKAARAETHDLSDQLLPAFTVVDRSGEPVGRVHDGDAVICFNFRGDRTIELSRAFTEGGEFRGFDRGEVPDVFYAGMTLYDGDTNIPANRLVEPEVLSDTVSEVLCARGVTQFTCAETQKFGHVTYFWNGNRSERFDPSLELYEEVPSDQVPFDQRPWMKSGETCDAVLGALDTGRYRFLRTNFAGGDMVGHTGVFDSAVLAVEAVDLAIGRIDSRVRELGGCLVVTADHGNAEDMIERKGDGSPVFRSDGSPYWKTAHSVNPVRFLVRDYGSARFRLRDNLPEAGLANVAATLLNLLGFEAPEMYEDTLVEPVSRQ